MCPTSPHLSRSPILLCCGAGVLDKVISEGTHFVIPFLERPIIFDVRTRPRAIKSTTGTRGESAAPTVPSHSCRLCKTPRQPLSPSRLSAADLQMVDIGLRVLTRPDATALPEVYRRLGMDYDDKASEATGLRWVAARVWWLQRGADRWWSVACNRVTRRGLGAVDNLQRCCCCRCEAVRRGKPVQTPLLRGSAVL